LYKRLQIPRLLGLEGGNDNVFTTLRSLTGLEKEMS
jgi:hypothetical protein